MRVARAPVCASVEGPISAIENAASEVRHEDAILHPVLVADLADDGARDFIEGVAIAHGRVSVPLVAAPIDGSLHVLEIHTPSREPLVVFAEPVGAPTDEGYPLRLKPIEPVVAGEAETLDEPLEAPPGPALRARSRNAKTLSEKHTRDLGGARTSPAAPDALIGRTLADGKLEILALVGKGGAGAVYRAMHRALRIPIAVKILHDSFQTDIEFCRRFHSEALSASRLDHSNVVRVVDFGQEPDGLLYIAMEYLDGIPLSRIVEEEAPVPLPRIVALMSQVLGALAHAHARGIVHRDVKPDNVVLVRRSDDDGEMDERVKVCDFGIAVPAFDARSARTIAGTPHYMSPEQVSGQPLDGRSDVYACGVLLYELATGRVPFGEGDARTIAACHVHATPVPPSVLIPTLDPAFERIILRALAKDPNARHQNARELRSELRALLRSPSGPSAEEVPPSSRGDVQRTPKHVVVAGDPEWIERGSDAYASALHSSTKVRAVAPEIVTSTTEWLKRYAETLKHEEFMVMTEQLEATLPALINTANTKTLFALRSTLDLLASGNANDARTARVVRLLKAFADPKLLAMVAETALLGKRGEDAAVRLLLAAKTPAAYAMYSVRLKLTGTHVRHRFIELIAAFAEDALPMIRAGLTKLEAHQNVPVAAMLTEDLLRGVPALYDDALGEVIARYVRGGSPRLRCAAIGALARVWGERSRPILIGVLGTTDDDARATAIRALGTIKGIDDLVAQKIEDLVRGPFASPAVRDAAREVLT
jgi:eukaryotic-like serine/threonine-protein kinase